MKLSIGLCLLLAVAGPTIAADKDAEGADKKKSTEVLIVGGGSSHDFDRWFNKEDVKILNELPGVHATYTSKPADVVPKLEQLDVLYLSSNQEFNAPGLREGIFKYARSGRGLLLIHPALWYNWRDWPEYNRVLAGGGSRSHDKLGEFEVTITATSHPIMAGVPTSFRLIDELYHFAPDKEAKLEVLATGKSPVTGKTFPVAWITQEPGTRIFCLTLGHDGRAHEHEAYRKILQNAAQWAAARESTAKR